MSAPFLLVEISMAAYELLWNFDAEFLDRLASLSVDGLVEYLRLTYLKFESFTSHFLDED